MTGRWLSMPCSASSCGAWCGGGVLSEAGPAPHRRASHRSVPADKRAGSLPSPPVAHHIVVDEAPRRRRDGLDHAAPLHGRRLDRGVVLVGLLPHVDRVGPVQADEAPWLVSWRDKVLGVGRLAHGGQRQVPLRRPLGLRAGSAVEHAAYVPGDGKRRKGIGGGRELSAERGWLCPPTRHTARRFLRNQRTWRRRCGASGSGGDSTRYLPAARRHSTLVCGNPEVLLGKRVQFNLTPLTLPQGERSRRAGRLGPGFPDPRLPRTMSSTSGVASRTVGL